MTQAVANDRAWVQVAAELAERHEAPTVVVDGSVLTVRERLRELRPTHIGVVVTPEEATASLVREVNVLSRTLDPGTPWVDARSGIVTAPTPADALRIVRTTAPLLVRRATASTGLDPELFRDLFTVSDGTEGDWTRREAGGPVSHGSGSESSLAAEWAAYLNTHEVDLVGLSGHATQVNMEVPFGKGSLIASGGGLHMLELEPFRTWLSAVSAAAQAGGYWWADRAAAEARRDATCQVEAIPVRPAPNPKVVVGAGSCYVGDALGIPDSLAMTWLGAGGATQLVGYAVATWFGAAGWGSLWAWLGSRGSLSLTEACYLNAQRVAARLVDIHPLLAEVSLGDAALACLSRKDHDHAEHPELTLFNEVTAGLDPVIRREALGLLFDRDSLAFFGDPAWEARLSCKGTTTAASWTRTGQHQWTVDVRMIEPAQPRAASLTVIPSSESLALRHAPEGVSAHVGPDFLVIDAPDRAGEVVTLHLHAAGRDRRNRPSLDDAFRFLLEHAAEQDRHTNGIALAAVHTQHAVQMRDLLPYAGQVPDELWLNDVLPFWVADEHRDFWRPHFQDRVLPSVERCTTLADAIDVVRTHSPLLFPCSYDTSRRSVKQGVFESIATGKATCTGLSLLLCYALRAACVPARLAGCPQWAEVGGNHTWVEAWDGGDWRCLEWGSADPLDKGWYVERAATADPERPLTGVYATSFRPTGARFPLAGAPRTSVPGVDRTEHYVALAGGRRPAVAADSSLLVIRAVDPAGRRVPLDVCVEQAGEVLTTGRTTGDADDVNLGLSVTVPVAAGPVTVTSGQQLQAVDPQPGAVVHVQLNQPAT